MFCIDLLENKLVQSAKSGAPVTLEFYQNDTPTLQLRGLMPNPDPLGDLYLPATIPYASLFACITLLDQAPEGGTWAVQVGDLLAGGHTTGALASNIAKADFQTALNALANVAAAGGVTVLTGGAPNIYRFEWNTPANAIAMTIVQNDLLPFCLSRYREDPDVPGKREIKIFKAPVAEVNDFTLPDPPPPTLTRVLAGSVGANEIQRITIPIGAVGSFAFIQGGITGEIIRVDSSTLMADMTAALNDPFTAVSPTDIRYSVTNPASGVYNIEFIGAYAKTAETLLTLALFDQIPTDVPTGAMPLTSLALEDLMAGAGSQTAQFIVVAVAADGKETTLVYQQCTIFNRCIDSPGVTQIQAVATRTNTIYVYPDSETDPTLQQAIAKLGSQFVNPALAANFVFTHNFNTIDVEAVVLIKTGSAPDTWQQMPDDQFEVDILNVNQVQLFFAAPIPASPAIGSVRVWICTLAAQPIINNFRMTTDQVDGVAPNLGSTLTQILAALSASLPDGWPNIPANKISGLISGSQIDLTSLSQYLTSSGDFLTTLRTLINDPTLITNLANNFASNTAFLTTLQTLAANASYLTSLMGALGSNADFIAAVKTAIGSMIIPGSMTLPFSPLAEILFSSGATDPTLLPSNRLAYMLPQIVSAAPGNLPIAPLPVPSASGGTVWQNNTGASQLISGGGLIRSANIAKLGYVGCDGRILYAVNNSANSSYYPAAFERELWRIYIDDKMLSVGKTLTAAFAIGLQLINATNAAQYCLVVEKGALPGNAAPAGDSLSLVNWDTGNPLVKQRIILTPTLISHNFGAIIARGPDAGGAQVLTAQGVYYSAAYAAPVNPATANFVLRARLIEFDTEDSIPNAKGWVSYSLQPDSYGSLGAKIA